MRYKQRLRGGGEGRGCFGFQVSLKDDAKRGSQRNKKYLRTKLRIHDYAGGQSTCDIASLVSWSKSVDLEHGVSNFSMGEHFDIIT